MRAIRKHRTALIALAIFHFAFFFPLLFMGRVVSPNDVYFNYDPWTQQPHAVVQNSLINDPPTSYLTLMSLLKSGGDAFHWNPYIAAGIPGFGSSAAAVLSPFILIPTLLVPLAWVYTAIIFLKLNFAFWFAYFWLREERLGKRGAAVGAIFMAAAGIWSVRWLWQSTNAVVLYPALLWIVRRLWRNRRVPIWLVALLALAYALSGFPAAMAYGAYLSVAYALFLAIRERRFPASRIALALLGVAIALAIAAPSLVPFVQLVRRTGYLAVREQASLQLFLPPSHWRSFFLPQRLGNNAYKNWIGAPALGTLNNFLESTVYLGLAAIPLALIAIANRRARTRWFWLAAALVIAGCMFGIGGFPLLIARLPGFKYSSLARMSMLLPVPIGYLAAAGSAFLARRRFGAAVAIALAVFAASDLAVFAGRFYPYLPPHLADVPATPTIAFLQAETPPFRIAPFFNYLWPNSSELFRLEDVRSHFSSEALYRRMLARVDPTSFGSASTILQFNSLKFDFTDPFVGMLGVRYFIEQKNIDIVKWTTFANTVPGVPEQGAFTVGPRTFARRTIRVDAEPFYAIELPVSVDETYGPQPRLRVTLARDDTPVYSRDFTTTDLAAVGKIYIPVRPFARLGQSVTLTVEPLAMKVTLLGATDARLFFGRVTTPVVFERELPDGRLFRNLAEVPRFHAVTKVRRLTIEQFLATKNIDFADEAIVTDAEAPLPNASPARVSLASYEPARQVLETEGAAPFFVASSEKLTPELAITIDGNAAHPIEINGLFAGVAVPAGTHEIIFSRRIARGWWWLAAAGLAALLVSAALRR